MNNKLSFELQNEIEKILDSYTSKRIESLNTITTKSILKKKNPFFICC